MSGGHRPTAGVVIIGDEVLSGKVTEENIGFFVGRFRELGVDLRHVAIVPDETEAIGRAVRDASDRFDIVCTTGGVGPTHDDITMDAIATGFGVPVTDQPRLLELVLTYFGDEPTEAQLRLARAPEGSELVGRAEPPWPTVRFRNVYVFPGIPQLLRAKFDTIQDRFTGSPLFAGTVEAQATEVEICTRLEAIVAAHPLVAIGSYPRRESDGWHVRVTVEALLQDDADAALADLRAALAPELTGFEPTRSTAGTD